ncbi:hypothetical protein RRG08_033877 [Elysia crispata]|uniref:Uncharacterized protein n=1 Tax=Elysia crispata TaxID=231223 RepID=A0AAE1EBS3_9GAST|nr:hypothetical protein RRG08_033877 [Elysia crispata]
MLSILRVTLGGWEGHVTVWNAGSEEQVLDLEGIITVTNSLALDTEVIDASYPWKIIVSCLCGTVSCQSLKNSSSSILFEPQSRWKIA